MHMFNDSVNNWHFHWWQIGIIKRLYPKIVLPHRFLITRLMNKTPPQSIMPTVSDHVVGHVMHFYNSQELCIERRTLGHPILHKNMDDVIILFLCKGLQFRHHVTIYIVYVYICSSVWYCYLCMFFCKHTFNF